LNKTAFITPNGKKELALENPATGELLTTVTLADKIDTERAIDAFSVYCGLGSTITGDDLLNVL
jgi:acyl-CoA reductase-like NAD-dependent aldehyde dehydrogenase